MCYGGEYGPDLENIAKHANLTPQEVIDIHSSSDYLIYMLGFLPGFSYLGGLDERIHTPRLANPRIKIPAGSVGIGGSQTGIYPLDSPGGWQLLGLTPVKTYDPNREVPILLKPATTSVLSRSANLILQQSKMKWKKVLIPARFIKRRCNPWAFVY